MSESPGVLRRPQYRQRPTRDAASESPGVLRRFKDLATSPVRQVSKLVVRRSATSDILSNDVEFERMMMDEDFFENMESSGREEKRKAKALQKEMHDVLGVLEQI